MLKKINYFILFIFIFEALSFIIGFGTHFEHYKYAIMISIVVLNSVAIKTIPNVNIINKNVKKKEQKNDI
tara:strand:+ start:522 stop:731 length:210 start_codon:yes stop_codon:yes gene_type:complete